MKKLINWFRSFIKISTIVEAEQAKLKHIRNIYGDEINQRDCRSIWKDEFGFEYKCSELTRH